MACLNGAAPQQYDLHSGRVAGWQDHRRDDLFIAGFVCKQFSQERHGRFSPEDADIQRMFAAPCNAAQIAD